MKILAIESSCDDTGVAILEYDKAGQPKILADLVSSQVKIHAKWGGVVPMLAKREHQRNLLPLLKKVLRKSKLLKNSKSEILNSKQTLNPKSKIQNQTLKEILEREPELLKKLLPFIKKYPKPDIDYVAVTNGPGLEPALWVGVNFARALSYFWNIPIIPVNHIEGHIAANWPNEKLNAPHPPLKLRGGEGELFPAIALVVSGGHTQLILIKKFGDYKIIGETRDDAAGEAFDKVAKMLGLGYPGGPIISQLATKHQSQANHLSLITNHFLLPRPMINSGDFDFSFSGLKTAVLYLLRKMTPSQIKKSTRVIAAEFQQAVIDVLTAKTLSSAKKYNTKTIILAGGVAANAALRSNLSLIITKHLSLNFLVPPINLCQDNATMIALAAYYQLTQKRAKKANWRTLKAQANLRIS
ncbi:tRNA (adenosine(37)-N6)-threonylcarbamoyltransferase complex transferase subunit TsaD [Patescibacteria group bacterium]|nr:tRNA (adenosine(37)-N6)-threonylcarbamoyltransferase complex transferase subunit TsaD [Patescibacteria group bacterium]